MSTQNNLLEITGDDIAELNDADLRALVGMLCEYDFRLENLPVTGILWGGSQDAADGGIDVSVSVEVMPTKSNFVPRNRTSFQVKKPDMPRSAILDEMRPKGILRDEIKSLIESRGAYIIVSSSGSTTGKAINNRIEAMQEAIAGEKAYENLHLDFYDRGRMATWVRLHPSMVLWVREKIGRPIYGWQTYGNWSNSPGGLAEEYLVDDELRLLNDKNSKNGYSTIADGIAELRNSLSQPKASIRLVGLSGVGKTRLVQALFDERIGHNALNPSLAFYTDISGSPSPDPESFAKILIAGNQKAILVVDNCTPDLHRRLTTACTSAKSEVSLITIEYDIRDDVPDETDVYKLQSASNSVIEKIILNRFPYLNQVDARVIADFSDGNARVAIALANNIEAGETLSGFRDDQLFKRLFWQRNERNESFLNSAIVCSVLYSFDGEDTSNTSELSLLASLAEVSVNVLYRDVTKLKDRDLVQSRGKWRAILPHAVANRLARRALDAIPKEFLTTTILNSGSERLIKSFARRLSYLHDSEVAVKIATYWLSEDGWVGGNVLNLSEFEMDVFKNLAPICPKIALVAIARGVQNSVKCNCFTPTENSKCTQLTSLLRKLAYDRELFELSTKLLINFALSEEFDENNRSSAHYALKSLFCIRLSGTRATVEERASIIDELLNSKEEKKQDLGIHLLKATLKTRNFHRFSDFSFGARPRDYGHEPTGDIEILAWFEIFLSICKRHILSNKVTSERAKNMLSAQIRDLWRIFILQNTVEDVLRTIVQAGFWANAWIAINEIIKYDNDEYISENEVVRLNNLRNYLKPKTPEELVRTYVLSNNNFPWRLMDEKDEMIDSHEQMDRKVQEIAALVYNDNLTFDLVLPDLVSTYDYFTMRSFGQGLAKASTDLIKLWEKIVNCFKATPKEKRHVDLLIGFLSSCIIINPNTYNCILDDTQNDNVLIEWLHLFQTVAKIDQKGVDRICESLDLGIINIENFDSRAYIDINERVSDDNLASYLDEIINVIGSFQTVFQILEIRFDEKNITPPSENLLKFCRSTLTQYSFSYKNRFPILFDENISKIANLCLLREFSEQVRTICKNIRSAMSSYHIESRKIKNLLKLLFKEYPKDFLDIFLDDSLPEYYEKSRMFSVSYQQKEPIIHIPDEVIENWCDKKPEIRYPNALKVIPTFYKPDGSESLEWRSFVHKLLFEGEYLEDILPELANSLRPTGWSGNLEDILQPRKCLIEELLTHPNDRIKTWANNQLLAIEREIEGDIGFRKRSVYQLDESFE